MNVSVARTKSTQSGLKRADSVIELVGNTPLIKLNELTEGISPRVEVYAKAEWFNPGGSVKDRPALWMILDGINSGKLTRDKILMDSSSGNTAIAYAMFGAALGYTVELVTPLNMNVERKKTLKAFGAKIIYSDPLEGSDGAIRLARKLKAENPDKYFMPDQYNNPVNPQAHYDTTAVEIWDQTNGRVTHFLAGLGTSGTFMGTSRRLKELNSDITTISIEPAESLHGLEGMKHMPSSIVPGIYDDSRADQLVRVTTEDAYDTMKDLLKKEGIFVGHSGGAVAYAALECARNLEEGVVVTVFPDGGYRYLSGGIWW